MAKLIRKLWGNQCEHINSKVFHKRMNKIMGDRRPNYCGTIDGGALFQYVDIQNIVQGYKIVNQDERYVKCYYTI